MHQFLAKESNDVGGWTFFVEVVVCLKDGTRELGMVLDYVRV